MEFLNSDIPVAKIEPDPEALTKVTRLNARIAGGRLTPSEQKFITEVKQRILLGRKLTVKQDEWLARIIGKCALQQQAADMVAEDW
jgi:hypothetical protein